MKKLLEGVRGGFTLVELLVVVGILSILAVAALVAINPAEAQRKARDTQRIKDLGTLQSLIEQYVNDNLGTVTAITRDTITHGGTTISDKKRCTTSGWTGLLVCPYANTVPVDPANRTVPLTNNATPPVQAAGAASYSLKINANAQYVICVRLESTANAAKLNEDGLSDNYLSVYSDSTFRTCP